MPGKDIFLSYASDNRPKAKVLTHGHVSNKVAP